MNMQETDHPQKKVLVIGNAILDVILTLPSLPTSGEDVFAKRTETVIGGCAYNVANILKGYGIDHQLMVPMGNGPNGKKIYEQLLKDHLSPIINCSQEDNGWCLSIVEEGGERTFITMQGLENHWKPEWFDNVRIDEYDYIYISGYTFEGSVAPVVLEGLSKKAKGTKVIFDPSPRAPYLDKDQLENLFQLNTIVHCNTSELSALTGTNDINKGTGILGNITHESVIVTMGGDGTFYRSKDGMGEVHEEPVTPVDTIGAGDAHTGGFITGLVLGKSVKEACHLGNIAAQKVVQVSGGKLPND